MNPLIRLAKHYYTASHWPEHLAPLLDLAIRLFLANVFIKSGLTKIQSWDSTLYLFNDVYQVPLLPPEIAAYRQRVPNSVCPYCWYWVYSDVSRRRDYSSSMPSQPIPTFQNSVRQG